MFKTRIDIELNLDQNNSKICLQSKLDKDGEIYTAEYYQDNTLLPDKVIVKFFVEDKYVKDKRDFFGSPNSYKDQILYYQGGFLESNNFIPKVHYVGFMTYENAQKYIKPNFGFLGNSMDQKKKLLKDYSNQDHVPICICVMDFIDTSFIWDMATRVKPMKIKKIFWPVNENAKSLLQNNPPIYMGLGMKAFGQAKNKNLYFIDYTYKAIDLTKKEKIKQNYIDLIQDITNRVEKNIKSLMNPRIINGALLNARLNRYKDRINELMSCRLDLGYEELVFTEEYQNTKQRLDNLLENILMYGRLNNKNNVDRVPGLVFGLSVIPEDNEEIE